MTARIAGPTEETMATNDSNHGDELLMFSAREAQAMLDGGVASITANEFNGVTVARLAMAVVHYAGALRGVSKIGRRAAAMVTAMEDRTDAAARDRVEMLDAVAELGLYAAQVAHLAAYARRFDGQRLDTTDAVEALTLATALARKAGAL